MAQAVTVSAKMQGSVNHHNNHIIGYKQVLDHYNQVQNGTDSDGKPKYTQVPVYRNDPIYCSGHSVTGMQTSGQSKVLIGGKPAAVVGDGGTSNCSCDGKGYTNVQGSSKVFINGKPAVRLGDKVNIHGQGTGVMTSGSSKVNFG